MDHLWIPAANGRYPLGSEGRVRSVTVHTLSPQGCPGPATPLVKQRQPCPGSHSEEGGCSSPNTRGDTTLLVFTLQLWNQAQSFSNFSNLRESESVGCSVSDSCDRMDCSPPGFSVHGISQARILEWVAISFFRGSSQPGD